MSTSPTLSYDSPISTWRPPADVPDHNGQPIDPSAEFFQTPPTEIGELRSAHSTLRAGKLPMPLVARLLLVVAVPAALAGATYLLAGESTRKAADLVYILGFIAVVASFFITWRVTRYRHTCSYVGALGVARFTLRGSRGAAPRQQLFAFAGAAELRTAQTRRFVNGVYSGTTYQFTWTDATGRRVYKLGGKYSSKEGTPKQKDPFWFASAAERAWSVYLLDRIGDELQAKGFVQFNLGGPNFVRVGPGFFEFGIKGDLARITTDEIKTLSLNAGQFNVHHKDAKWFSRKGKFGFQYAQMANARLFLLAMEKLTGYRFG